MKKVIRLTENDLHRIVEKSVKRILKEGSGYFGDIDDDTRAPWNQSDDEDEINPEDYWDEDEHKYRD